MVMRHHSRPVCRSSDKRERKIFDDGVEQKDCSLLFTFKRVKYLQQKLVGKTKVYRIY